MAGNPVALEESLRHQVHMILDGLPQLAVGALGNVVVRVFHDSIEDTDSWFAVTLDTGGNSSGTDDVKQSSRFSLV